MTSARPDALDQMIAAVPWSRLAHAYDVALDAPPMLKTLAASVAGGTSEGVDDLEEWLLGSVVHQGTPYSATAPVLWIARRILGEDPTHPVLGSCLQAVEEVATTLRWIDGSEDRDADAASFVERNEDGEPLWATCLPPDRPLAPAGQDGVHDDYFVAATPDPATLAACVRDWEQTVVDCVRDRLSLDEAVAAAGAMVRHSASPGLVEALRSLVHGPEDDGLRAASAFALAASGWSAALVDGLIDDPDPVVRLGGALGSPDHVRAAPVLVAAAVDRASVRATFPQGFAGPEPWLTPAVVSAVLDRVPVDTADARLVDGLEQQLATVDYGPMGATYEWGPVLRWLFPDRWQPSAYVDMPSSGDLSDTQRRLLGALVRNDDPWVDAAGNAGLVLGQVGLPHDRALVAALVGAQRPRRWPRWRHRP